MKILKQANDYQYVIRPYFKHEYLDPIAKYVSWKLANNWDDYNELHHACRLVHAYDNNDNIKVDVHNILKEDEIIGLVLMASGHIDKVETRYAIENPKKSLLLKYFHITEKGSGLGTYWLQEELIPYYASMGFRHIYINSSHPLSFPFYLKFGNQISTYDQQSDNNLFRRKGACFKINIG
ncbi:MAG: hypothetical protein JXQ90_09385 [Cyclobacteriaceae bacterium]